MRKGKERGIMAIELPDARQLSDPVLEALRLRALHGREQGHTETHLADILGLRRETISRWWSAYEGGGLDAIPQDRTGRPLGSGRTLDEQQAVHLQEKLNDHTPEDWGIASPLWTRRAVRDLIRTEYGIDMPIRTVGEYLKRWGFTAQKPAKQASTATRSSCDIFHLRTIMLQASGLASCIKRDPAAHLSAVSAWKVATCAL